MERQTDKSNFIGRCLTNVKRPVEITILQVIDDVDHNVVIVWTNLHLQTKQNLFHQNMHKRGHSFNIFDTRLYFDQIFWDKKDKLFSPIFAFRRGMSNVICDLVLYL